MCNKRRSMVAIRRDPIRGCLFDGLVVLTGQRKRAAEQLLEEVLVVSFLFHISLSKRSSNLSNGLDRLAR